MYSRWASRPRLASKVTPSPQPGHGAYKGTLWDPAAKIAHGQVARNSNLKLGDRPRASQGFDFEGGIDEGDMSPTKKTKIKRGRATPPRHKLPILFF